MTIPKGLIDIVLVIWGLMIIYIFTFDSSKLKTKSVISIYTVEYKDFEKRLSLTNGFLYFLFLYSIIFYLKLPLLNIFLYIVLLDVVEATSRAIIKMNF